MNVACIENTNVDWYMMSKYHGKINLKNITQMWGIRNKLVTMHTEFSNRFLLARQWASCSHMPRSCLQEEGQTGVFHLWNSMDIIENINLCTTVDCPFNVHSSNRHPGQSKKNSPLMLPKLTRLWGCEQVDMYEFVASVSWAGTQSSIYLKRALHPLPKAETRSLQMIKYLFHINLTQ
jgi:hypothetical protein